MSDAAVVQTVSGIEVPEPALQVAKAVAEIVRDASVGLPFGMEPGDFLVALERLADPETRT